MGEEQFKARRPLGPHLTRDLYRWAEYHQGQFSKKTMQQGLRTLDMGIINGEMLQAGSDSREYQRFVESLETKETRAHTAKTLDANQIPAWMAQLGMGCTLLSV